ncbi:MAG: FkbM family methyltransferase [Deltaproteobacteria bacterium]
MGRVRQLVRRWLRPATAVVKVDGLELSIDPRTEIGGVLWRGDDFERQERDIAAELFAAGDPTRAIVDVGAHIGLHVLAWARRFEHAEVVAIEPGAAGAMLRRNVGRNELGERIDVIECALSDHVGEADLYLARDDAYTALTDTRRHPIMATTRVAVRTLDSVAAELAVPLGLVKIDVEGHEDAVIAGGRACIARDKPVLFVEIYGGVASNRDPEATIATVRGLGYAAFVVGAAGLEPFVRHDDRRYNYFFIPR